MWVRGLKHFDTFEVTQFYVAPHVGAWIETSLAVKIERSAQSHPMWVRGLKLSVRREVTSPTSRTPCGCVD